MQKHYKCLLQSNHTIKHMLQKGDIKGRKEIPRIIFGVISFKDTDIQGKPVGEYMEDVCLLEIQTYKGRPTVSQSHMVSHGGSWQHHQIPSHGSTSTVNFQHHHPHPQPSAEKSEMEALKTRLKRVEDLLSSSSSIVGSTLEANSGKNFILSKIFTITENLPSIDPRLDKAIIKCNRVLNKCHLFP